MPFSKSLLILSLPLLSYSAPLRSHRDILDNDDPQAFFTVAGTSLNDNDMTTTTTTSDPSTFTSHTGSVSNSVLAQHAFTTVPPSVTSIWFAPDDATPSPTPSPSSNNDGKTSPRPSSHPIVAAYYPDWTASQLSPDRVDFDRLDWVDFAFAVPDSSTFVPKFLQDDSEDLLNRLVAAAHAKNKNIKLSIGGWTGSGHFSDAVSAENRNAFAGGIVALYHKFNLDGIDIDWEYPGEAGAPGNTYTPADSANFLAFLRLLRSLLPKEARITAATQVWPFMDTNGDQMRDVSAFAQVLDWVLLMNYDVWGSSSNPGSNAPLSDACHNSTQPEANAHAAIKSWTAAGFPAQQIMLGLPAYGYVSRTNATTLRTRRRSLPMPSRFDRTPISTVATSDGDNLKSKTASAADTGAVTVMSEGGSAESGQVQFSALVAQGALTKNTAGGSPKFVAAGGFERDWDACSSTPFLRSGATEQIITYDDPESLGMKAAFARQAGILGVNMWDAHGDTQQWDLIDGVRRGLGIE